MLSAKLTSAVVSSLVGKAEFPPDTNPPDGFLQPVEETKAEVSPRHSKCQLRTGKHFINT